MHGLVAVAACGRGIAGAQGFEPAQAQVVTVTSTRSNEAAFDIPSSVNVVTEVDVRDAFAQVNISESLGEVPGLFARDRQNYAQDVQLSIRGFGARSTFGLRGIRVYVDGIPATLPDGQGQITNVDLNSVQRIEVLRGPFSSLYGNSSGGVLQVFTEQGSGAPTLEAGFAAGSNGLQRESLKASGADGALGYVLSASHFATDGWRAHSAAQRDLGNAKLTYAWGDSDNLSLIANAVSLPSAQDPLGLTRAEYAADPRAVDPSALQFNTRKSTSQTQGGFTWAHRFGPATELQWTTYTGHYTGHRSATQYQAIPVATQANPLNPGGVIELGRDYSGNDVRLSHTADLGGQSLTLIAGFSYDTLQEHRQGYQNFVGSTLGVEGALRRDERNVVSSADPYAQLAWKPGRAWEFDLGVRRSDVAFRSHDFYVTATNPDDSGRADYRATLPVLGTLFKATNWLHLYANAAKGFETPTLNELAYRADGGSGLNFGLRPAHSRSFEAGAKANLAAAGEVDLAVFDSDTSDEIVTLTNVGGRSTYQNGGRTRRTGVELSWTAQLPADLHWTAALATLDARYRDGFLTCATTPCAAPKLAIPAGNRIPGTSPFDGFAELSWRPGPWSAGVDLHAVGRVMVNDANSDAAAAYATVGAHLKYSAAWRAWRFSGFARADNVFDRQYAGSVIVNEGNGRYFEPALRRTWLAGASAAYSF
jgi:iron complex outermembrane receptor protein